MPKRVDRRAGIVLLVMLFSWGLARPGRGLTLAETVALARRQAPTVRLALAQVAEAQAAIAAADVPAVANPAVEALVGPSGPGGGWLGGEVSLLVPIERGGKRAARVEVAKAAVERDEQIVSAARARAAAAAAEAWLRLRHARQRHAVASERAALAEELRRVATERERAGKVARFSVNLADSEVAQAIADVAGAAGDVVNAEADLALGLGLPGDVTVDAVGSLADVELLLPGGSSQATVAAVAQRPDLRVLQREVALANAQVHAARAARSQDLGLVARWERNESGHTVVAGLSVPLPVFQDFAGAAAVAMARARRSELELTLREQAARTEVHRALAGHATAVLAAQAIGDAGLRRIEDNERLALDSYRAGKLDLQSLLFLRRSALELRRDHLDRQLVAALSALRLWQVAGAP